MLVCGLLLFTGAKALTYPVDTVEEPTITYAGHVAVSGDGKIESTTYTPLASDAVDSRGESQEYSRSFTIGGESESEAFNSEYSLKNSHGYESRYMVAMHGVNEMLQHKVSVEGNSDINSIVSINRHPVFYKDSDAERILLSDSFRISGNDSKIGESVIDLKLGFHPVGLVDTLAQGKIVSISSGLTEDSTGFSSELDQIKVKLPPVNKVLISVFGNAINATKFTSLDKQNLTANMISDFELNADKNSACKLKA